MSMSVDGLPTFLDDKNTTSTPCQTYESAEGDTSALPEKPQKTLVDRCYVLLTPLKKTPSSSGSTSESLLPPANRSTHSRTPQRQRGDAVPATNLNAGADRLEGSQPSKQAHKRGRGPSRSAPSSRRGSNHQSDVDDSPTEYREVQAIPHPPGMIRHLLDLVFDLATSAFAIFGVYIVFVLLIQAYRSMNHSSCEVFLLRASLIGYLRNRERPFCSIIVLWYLFLLHNADVSIITTSLHCSLFAVIPTAY